MEEYLLGRLFYSFPFTPLHSFHFYKPPSFLFCLKGCEKTLPALFRRLRQGDKDGANKHEITSLDVVSMGAH